MQHARRQRDPRFVSKSSSERVDSRDEANEEYLWGSLKCPDTSALLDFFSSNIRRKCEPNTSCTWFLAAFAPPHTGRCTRRARQWTSGKQIDSSEALPTATSLSTPGSSNKTASSTRVDAPRGRKKLSLVSVDRRSTNVDCSPQLHDLLWSPEQLSSNCSTVRPGWHSKLETCSIRPKLSFLHSSPRATSLMRWLSATIRTSQLFSDPNAGGTRSPCNCRGNSSLSGSSCKHVHVHQIQNLICRCVRCCARVWGFKHACSRRLDVDLDRVYHPRLDGSFSSVAQTTKCPNITLCVENQFCTSFELVFAGDLPSFLTLRMTRALRFAFDPMGKGAIWSRAKNRTAPKGWGNRGTYYATAWIMAAVPFLRCLRTCHLSGGNLALPMSVIRSIVLSEEHYYVKASLNIADFTKNRTCMGDNLMCLWVKDLVTTFCTSLKSTSKNVRHKLRVHATPLRFLISDLLFGFHRNDVPFYVVWNPPPRNTHTHTHTHTHFPVHPTPAFQADFVGHACVVVVVFLFHHPTSGLDCRFVPVRYSRYNKDYIEPTFRFEDLTEPLDEMDERKFRPIKAARNDEVTSLNHDPLVKYAFTRQYLALGWRTLRNSEKKGNLPVLGAQRLNVCRHVWLIECCLVFFITSKFIRQLMDGGEKFAAREVMLKVCPICARTLYKS